MAKFNFEARDTSGKKIKGIEEALNSDDLISRLQNRGLLVTNITEIPEIIGAKENFYRAPLSAPVIIRKMHRGVKLDDLVMFSRQLATMLGAGISLLKSLEVIAKQVESKALFTATSKIIEDVKGGVSFHEAVSRHSRIFSSLWANLIETGEASGNLPVILDRLAYYLEQKAAFRSKIISALIYPALLFIVAFAAIFFFTFKIIPTFSTLFVNLNIKMPTLTKMVVAFSDFLRGNILFIIIGVAITVFLLKRYIKTDIGKRKFDEFKFKMPILGNFFKVVAVENFISEISTLVESGVPILYALDICERSSENVVMQDVIRNVKVNVREGKSLADPLEKSNFFNPMVIQMTRVGEEIGELAPMLKKMADFYRQFIETQLARFTSLFEPLMIIFMGLVIGTLVISMYLPIFSIATGGGMGGS